MHSYLSEKHIYHYKKGAILHKISYISSLDDFKETHTKNKFYYKKDSVICLHYLNDLPLYYEKNTHLLNKKITQN